MSTDSGAWLVSHGGGWAFFVHVFECLLQAWECINCAWLSPSSLPMLISIYGVDTYSTNFHRNCTNFPDYPSTVFSYCILIPWSKFSPFFVSMEYMMYMFSLLGCARCWCFFLSIFSSPPFDFSCLACRRLVRWLWDVVVTKWIPHSLPFELSPLVSSMNRSTHLSCC